MKSAALCLIAAFGCLQLAACKADHKLVAKPFQDIRVLDGDTLVVEGQWVRVRGIDAPELGPWARCWADAGLGGASRAVLEARSMTRDLGGSFALTNQTSTAWS